jgi:hypothetical protein
MSDSWINRLVVAGPLEEAKTFAKAATGFEPPELDSPSDKPLKTPLSFTALYNLLPAKAKRRVPKIEDEPAGLISERLVTGKNGNAEKIYRFELSRHEPDSLFDRSAWNRVAETGYYGYGCDNQRSVTPAGHRANSDAGSRHRELAHGYLAEESKKLCRFGGRTGGRDPQAAG